MSKVVLSHAPWTILGYKKNGKPIYAIAGGADDNFSFDGAGGPDGGYTGDSGAAIGGDGANPAWNDLLKDVPQELHEKVTPHLKQWDSKFQEQVQKVQQQYDPWKPIMEASGQNPEAAQFALQLVQALNTNPKEVWDNLGEYYKFTGQTPQGQGGQGQNEPNPQDDPLSPLNQQIAAQQQQLSTMADIMLAQRTADEARRADEWLDGELTRVKASYGDIPDKFLIAGMQGGQTMDDAAQEYNAMIEKAAATYRPRPLIMGSGGGAPGSQVDPSKLSEKDTKNLVVQMLQANNALRD